MQAGWWRGLQKKQEKNDPGCSNQEKFVFPTIDIEQLVWLWNHCCHVKADPSGSDHGAAHRPLIWRWRR